LLPVFFFLARISLLRFRRRRLALLIEPPDFGRGFIVLLLRLFHLRLGCSQLTFGLLDLRALVVELLLLARQRIFRVLQAFLLGLELGLALSSSSRA
jgi:hypothetical protein